MEMIVGQLWYFAASLLWGIVLMLFYDILEVFRRKIKHGRIGRLVEDWLFWAIAALFVFQMVFALNNGIIRSFFVVSFVAGMALYRQVAKEHVINGILAVIAFIFRPYVWFSKKIHKFSKKTLK
ncbi:MAG: spore cortex biosynthesis protein YabQ [Lachnospiraceae bacterium]|nr:spore cortex biosynthesis protein YabQ [Lachnospiraceae bacterium]